MKRGQFLTHLKKNDCILLRNGANHDMYINTKNLQQAVVGRHTELDNVMCKIIC